MIRFFSSFKGTDEALMKKFVQKGGLCRGTGQPARSESKEKLTKELYKDFEGAASGRISTPVSSAPAPLFANKAEALRQGIDQHIENISRNGKPARNMLHSEGLAKAKKLLPSDPEPWLYYRLDYLKKLPVRRMFSPPQETTPS